MRCLYFYSTCINCYVLNQAQVADGQFRALSLSTFPRRDFFAFFKKNRICPYQLLPTHPPFPPQFDRSNVQSQHCFLKRSEEDLRFRDVFGLSLTKTNCNAVIMHVAIPNCTIATYFGLKNPGITRPLFIYYPVFYFF